MAKVVAETEEVIVADWRWEYLKIIGVATALGALWWAVSALIRHYVADEVIIAGNIAHIILAVIGTVSLLRLNAARPLIVAIGSVGVLWGLGGFVDGLSWYETLAWSVGLYIFSYLLFSLVARIRTLAPSVVVALAIVVIARIVLAL